MTNETAQTTLTRAHRFSELVDLFPPQDPAELPLDRDAMPLYS